MSGLGIIAMVLVRGTKVTFSKLGRWIAANDLEGSQRAGGVVLRLLGALCLVWFGGGMLWALDALQYVLPVLWFVCAAVWGGDVGEDEVVEEDAASRPSHDDVARVLHSLTGDANGVHLSAVAARLEIEQPVVRALLDEMEVRVRKSVKIKNVGVAVGVHRDDLPPLPSPTPSEEGQEGGSDALTCTTATATPFQIRQTESGPEIWVDNPLNPAQTVILRPAHREAS